MLPNMSDDAKYISRLPRSVPAGRVLAHNPVQATTVDQLPGVRGFRAFTFPAAEVPDNFVPCNCGWSGLAHYRPTTRSGEPWQPTKAKTAHERGDSTK
jgi:hypothetical protein